MVSPKTELLGRAIDAAERGWVPDRLVRSGIRGLLRARLNELQQAGPADAGEFTRAFAEQLKSYPVAEHTDLANEQHYEVPPAFFQTVLGPRLKYSSCYYASPRDDLATAEEQMLGLTGERAQLADGMKILDLGCGWGSFSLWAAENYPGAQVLAVSNSGPQVEFVRGQARARGHARLEAVRADINDFTTEQQFDRIVSVEMFEHVRNYAELMNRVSTWLAPGGKLFVHIFTHREWPYLFETEGAHNWMGRYFFSGGTMPSHALLLEFQDALEIEALWRINGTHYARTLEAWLANLDRNRPAIEALFEGVYGAPLAARWVQRWRMFFLACAELFAYREGEEWGVSHYRFVKR